MKKAFTFVFLFFTIFYPLLSAPIAPSCIQSTSSHSSSGFGILNVTFNTINNTTPNGVEGYQDYSGTINTNVLAGQTYTLSVDVSGAGAGKHNVRVWIDYNNDGTLDSIAELVYSANSVQTTTGPIFIPSTAIRNTELRMRVSADFELAAPFGPCRTLQYGQAEDYAITILNNPNPPEVSFTADVTTTCSGTVSFTDNSSNIPTAWLWNFGDGANSTSTQQHPVYTYTTNGTYTIKLRASNGNGNDEDSLVNYITVTIGAAPIAASCSPATVSYCCQHGITRVNFGSINNSTDYAVEGYKDFSCTQSAEFFTGTYPITIETGTVNSQDVKVWIDFDNDGIFNSTNEQVFSSLNQTTHTGNITIPTSAVTMVPLRMRVIADYGGNLIGPCASPDWGQAEDYTVISKGPVGIREDAEKPVLHVFPNPTNGLITIEHTFRNKENISIFISDIWGREVQKTNSSGTSKQVIDISSQPKGIYFVELISGENRLVKKIILQ